MENIVVNNSKYAKGRQSDFGSDGVGSTPTLEVYKCFFCGKEYKTKQGWVSEARVLLGWSTNKVGNYIRKNYPELKVFTRKK